MRMTTRENKPGKKDSRRWTQMGADSRIIMKNQRKSAQISANPRKSAAKIQNNRKSTAKN
jgi:hypothetical protein